MATKRIPRPAARFGRTAARKRPGRAARFAGGAPAWVARSSESSSGGEVDLVEPIEGMVLLQGQVWKFLDLRDEAAYDEEHLTKPPQCSRNLPMPNQDPSLLPQAAKGAGLSKTVPWLVADADGSRSSEAAMALVEAGWGAAAVVGGYRGWREVWTHAGRRVPPKGRWVATGKEALKSGLNVGGAALSYEERLNVEDLSKDEFKDFK